MTSDSNQLELQQARLRLVGDTGARGGSAARAFAARALTVVPDPPSPDTRTHAWSLVRDGYLAALSQLPAGDPDRALMLEQCRLATEIGGLPPIAPAAASSSLHEAPGA